MSSYDRLKYQSAVSAPVIHLRYSHPSYILVIDTRHASSGYKTVFPISKRHPFDTEQDYNGNIHFIPLNHHNKKLNK